MKPKLRSELVKVINGLDRTLEGWPGDWVSKVSEVSLENELHIEALERGMNAALGPREDMHNFLQFFSTYHGKIVAGWGPWKKPASTAHEARARSGWAASAARRVRCRTVRTVAARP